MDLITDVHREPSISFSANKICLVKGRYEYYHYGCDGKDDRGWGCGYRTLQSLCSWVKHQQGDQELLNVPSLIDIQKALVEMGDKGESFVNSREWIGSFEVCLCLDYFYNIPCKILHIGNGQDLKAHIQDIIDHFEKLGSPIMMGGDTDNSSKGILGASMEPVALLVMDPHFFGQRAESAQTLVRDGWVKWVPVEDFRETSFYNLCLPQLAAKDNG